MTAEQELLGLLRDMRATRVRDGLKPALYALFCDRLEHAIKTLVKEQDGVDELEDEEAASVAPPPPPLTV